MLITDVHLLDIFLIALYTCKIELSAFVALFFVYFYYLKRKKLVKTGRVEIPSTSLNPQHSTCPSHVKKSLCLYVNIC